MALDRSGPELDTTHHSTQYQRRGILQRKYWSYGGIGVVVGACARHNEIFFHARWLRFQADRVQHSDRQQQPDGVSLSRLEFVPVLWFGWLRCESGHVFGKRKCYRTYIVTSCCYASVPKPKCNTFYNDRIRSRSFRRNNDRTLECAWRASRNSVRWQ